MTQGDIVSSLDLLDIDEEVIDNRLKTFMTRNNLTNKHLNSVFHLLQYKTLINTREESECENNEEFDFIVKLLNNLNDENVDHICKIINIVLCLNPSSLLSKAEHLLQQLLINIETELLCYQDSSMLLHLKLCDSIIDAVLKFDSKLSLIFIKTPLEDILNSSNGTLKKYFLTNTVPNMFKGIIGYNIMDRIWDYLKKFEGDKIDDALKILSSLADYYMPATENARNQIISDVIFQNEFWSIVEHGLSSDDAPVRKIGVYLAKRATDCVVASKKNINLEIYYWKNNDSESLKSKWSNFFILLESLEEKQGNIVLPSLKLFETIDIGEKWMYCAFKLGLKHDNFQVRLKCMEYRLNYPIKRQYDAFMLLEALNDINVYDQNVELIKIKLSELINDEASFLEIFKTIPQVKWSPVPLFHITSFLSNAKVTQTDFIEAAIDVLKIPCNNVILRKEIHTNIGKILCKSSNIKWQDIIRIFSAISFDNLSELKTNHPFVLMVKEMSLESEEKTIFMEDAIKNCKNVNILTVYLCNHIEDENKFIDIISKKIDAFENSEHQNSDIEENLHFVMTIMILYNFNELSDNIRVSISKRNYTLMEYIYNLFKQGVSINIEDIVMLLKIKKFDYENSETATRMAVYRQCLTAHFSNQPTDPSDFDAMQNAFCMLHLEGAEFTLMRKILYMFLLRLLLTKPYNCLTERSSSFELLNDFLNLYFEYKSKENTIDCVGRLKNIEKEISCEILYLLTKIVAADELATFTEKIIDFLENALECGGYGCLEWILKTSNLLLVHLIEEPSFNLSAFFNKLWQEIEELKSNNQYNVCIKSFINVITNDALLRKGDYNNVVSLYITRITELSAVKIHPLYYLLKELESKEIDKYGHLVYGLCDILLFNPVRRKDERISDNLTLELLQDQNGLIQNDALDTPFPFMLQYLSLSIICNANSETVKIMRRLITNKIGELFKNKQRYHGNSQLHRTLQIALQHLIMSVVIDRSDLKEVFNWSLEMFVKLPHQSSVRICFEWFTALYFYVKKTTINEEMLQTLKTKNIPITSQFYIVYWLLKHRIHNNSNADIEFEFVMDFLLSNTMGQLFNVRLNAQYLSTLLYKLSKKPVKYEYTISLIERTFAESSLDKTFVKLQSDHFVQDFDVISNLTPYFLYQILPSYCGVTSNEKVISDYVKTTSDYITKKIEILSEDEFISEWKMLRKFNEDFKEISVVKAVDGEIDGNVELSGVLQKKYIPWKSMSDVNVYDVMKKRQSSSELIVVASLIDKLPNLGGMARTSEVFGVKTYVVDSLRHLQDRQFQNLSVSAERWIDVEEVRPSHLKEYLMKRKSEGYSVVAAEQTSSSCPLQTFKFPKKTLLLLGHEKEGVPCDLLPVMDHCVEIPQQGYVRSLNVHVTAAIFVWEYARQNVL